MAVPAADDQLVHEADWLATYQCFYNLRTGAYSADFNAVVDFEHFDWDYNGLLNYLQHGYSILGRTPVADVHFVQPFHRLYQRPDGSLYELEQPAQEQQLLDRLQGGSSIEQAVATTRQAVQAWEHARNGPILLPLSGGYDSRFLLHLASDRSRFRCFTYGTSLRQTDSREVVRARYVAHWLGLHWDFVHMDRLLDEWPANYRLFGASSFVPSMYYHRLVRKATAWTGPNAGLLSGLNGDAWGGQYIRPIEQYEHLERLRRTFGLYVDSRYARFSLQRNAIKEAFFEQYRQRLQNWRYRIVWLMRLRAMCQKHLLTMPEALGNATCAPFIQEGPSLALLNLPAEEREGRRWQKRYFQQHKLELSNVKFRYSREIALYTYVKPLVGNGLALNERLLSEILDPAMLAETNKNLQRRPATTFWRWLNKGMVGRRWARPYAPRLRFREAYYRFVVLSPLSQLLEDREAHHQGRPTQYSYGTAPKPRLARG